MKHFLYSLLVLFVMLSSCSTEEKMKTSVDWQGHRGARGAYPENTWRAFQYALENNMQTMEMDVVITKDKKVVLSHEPYLNHKICLDSTGGRINEEKETQYNIYQMSYEELQSFDCGAIQNPDFTSQKTYSSPKPLLSSLLDSIKAYTKKQNIELPALNVEIKFVEEQKNIFHPGVKEYSDLVYNVLKSAYPLKKWNIQSFNFDVLKYFHKTYPEIKLAALVYKNANYQQHFDDLGFTPEIYSPYYELVNREMIDDLHKKEVKVIPWTVNKEEVASRLIELEVDGIITDYPSIAASFNKNP